MALRDALTAFAVVFPAELPDKSMVVTLALSARSRRPGAIWLGAAGAFAVSAALASTAGSVLGRLPVKPVAVVAGCLFLAAAVLAWRSAASHDGSKSHDASNGRDEDETGDDEDVSDRVLGRLGPDRTWVSVAAIAAGTIFVAELGDFTQLSTAALSARTGAALEVGVGAWLASVTVAGLAATVGGALAARLPVAFLQRVAAGVFLVVGVASLYAALR
jgi:Ca2+/H+ antiporter, TMEM165/GDT1 family